MDPDHGRVRAVWKVLNENLDWDITLKSASKLRCSVVRPECHPALHNLRRELSEVEIMQTPQLHMLRYYAYMLLSKMRTRVYSSSRDAGETTTVLFCAVEILLEGLLLSVSRDSDIASGDESISSYSAESGQFKSLWRSVTFSDDGRSQTSKYSSLESLASATAKSVLHALSQASSYLETIAITCK